MIVKIAIKDVTTNEEGVLQYDNDENQRSVAYGTPGASEELEAKVRTHMHTSRDYKVPVDPETDEFEIHTQIPIKGVMYFELALSSLLVEQGVKLGKEIKE